MLASGRSEHSISIVNQLLSFRGIDVNLHSTDGETALIRASPKGHTAVVNLLLSSQEIRIDMEDKHRRTALFVACQYGHSTIVDSFLKISKRHNLIISKLQTIGGDTPLSLACKDGGTGIFAVLDILPSFHDLDVNMKNDDGETALMHICEHGYKNAVETLLLHPSVTVNQQNNDGEAALMLDAEKDDLIL